MTDQGIREGQLQRAKRLREQIERLKSERSIPSPGTPQSLRAPIGQRAHTARIDEPAYGEVASEPAAHDESQKP